ncbi:MAG: hypothetical protein LBN05_08025 [Oscillospiraceae bacterium]|jgi:hypothetical protein|nr:hypothetical protein [Oscillospiraceae bacterium]
MRLFKKAAAVLMSLCLLLSVGALTAQAATLVSVQIKTWYVTSGGVAFEAHTTPAEGSFTQQLGCEWEIYDANGKKAAYTRIDENDIDPADWVLIAEGLKPGQYTVKAIYTADYVTKSATVAFTVPKPLDMAKLETAIDKCLTSSLYISLAFRYTPESRDAFVAAVADLEKYMRSSSMLLPGTHVYVPDKFVDSDYLERSGITQKDIDASAQKLTDAYNGLEKRGGLIEILYSILDNVFALFDKITKPFSF